MLKKFIISFLIGLFIGVAYLIFGAKNELVQQEPVKKSEEKKVEPLKEAQTTKVYSYRKYLHVKNFYKDIAQSAVDIGLKYNVPPAALLAIAGVESGYGRGYVARITGNILSLGAGANEPELPALYLPNLKDDKYKILYSEHKIKAYEKSQLEWKKRPASLKKDYRPKSVAGSTKELDFLDKNTQARKRAYEKCMEDFAKDWISLEKKYDPFVDARVMLNDEVKEYSKDILFDEKLSIKFIRTISGKANSFNYRPTWAPKVISIMQKTGLIDLTKALAKKQKTFQELW